MRCLTFLSSLLVLALSLASNVCACSIPVFRYGLERWRPDSCELIVFYDTELSAQDEQLVFELESTAFKNDGLANAKFIRATINAESTDGYQPIGETLRDEHTLELPYVVVRTKLGRGQTINHWHGSLDDVRSTNLLQSPARKELSRRLLLGDSIVWLMLGSPDEKRTQATREVLSTAFKTLHTKVMLPEGVGLPGSELHSDVPLLVKFSLLEMDPEDEREQFLVQLLSGFEPEAISDREPLLVPVFGRGRALEVIPARDIDCRLIGDVTLFLSGACSCQVKEQNLGFDLLITEDWDTQLFGEDGQRPRPAKTVADRAGSPVLLNIPPGNQR